MAFRLCIDLDKLSFPNGFFSAREDGCGGGEPVASGDSDSDRKVTLTVSPDGVTGIGDRSDF